MATQHGPTSHLYRPRFRLDDGMAVLDDWAATAGQVDKNAVYRALLTVPDGSVFRAYPIVDDMERPKEFFVLARDDIAIKIRLRDFDSFGIVYIGPIGTGMARDRALADP